MKQKYRDGARVVIVMIAWLFVAENAVALCSGSNENAAVPSTTPSASFVVNADGTVLDKTTGLVWKRCSEGQVWDGATCTGTAAPYTWAQALALNGQTHAGHSDWRLPNVKELRSLVEQRCWSPLINVDIFPNTPLDWFWSSSPYAGSSNSAWSVHFGNGNSYRGSLGLDGRVRLVRAGQ